MNVWKCLGGFGVGAVTTVAAVGATIPVDFAVAANVEITHAHAFYGTVADGAGGAPAIAVGRFAISPCFMPGVEQVFTIDFDANGMPLGRPVAGLIGLAGDSVVVALESARAATLFANPEYVGFNDAFQTGLTEPEVIGLLQRDDLYGPDGQMHEALRGFFEGLMATDMLPAVQYGTLPAVQHPGLPIALPNAALVRFSDAQYAGDFTAVVPEPASGAAVLIAAALGCRRRF